MKLQSFKRVFSKDFDEEQQDLVDKLSLSINPAIEDTHLALSNRLTFADNFQAQIDDIEISVDANGTPISSIAIKLKDVNMKVNGLVIIACRNTENSSSYPKYAPFIFWSLVSNTIKINNVCGLTANVKYSVRVLIF